MFQYKDLDSSTQGTDTLLPLALSSVPLGLTGRLPGELVAGVPQWASSYPRAVPELWDLVSFLCPGVPGRGHGGAGAGDGRHGPSPSGPAVHLWGPAEGPGFPWELQGVQVLPGAPCPAGVTLGVQTLGPP